MTIDKDQLLQLVSARVYSDDLQQALNDTLCKYTIDSDLRVNHFLAQILNESGGLTHFVENVNYSAERLVVIFPHYFPNNDIADGYAHQPEKIANRVYANRMGNGDEASGDGWKFRGMGAIQITGKSNRVSLSKDLGKDFIGVDSELLIYLPYSILSAGWYWNSRNLNALADNDDIVGITKAINGGTIGLEERKAWLEKCKSVIK